MLEIFRENMHVDENFELPEELTTISQKIKSAKVKILELEDDFDGEGSVKYEPSTLNMAISFINKVAMGALKINKTVIKPPKLLPGPDGSIDVVWKESNFQLLINFPHNDKLASYYGEDVDGNTTEGLFDPRKLDQVFLFWLMDH
ncbi:MAG: hypothetical protein ACFFCS_29830 [Candidatus Hodarchaeota archaeon]